MLLNTQTRKWSIGPEMNNTRHAHGCTTIPSTEQNNAQIIVVGGLLAESTVEILDVSSRSWFHVEKIPLENLKYNSLTASNSPEYKLYSIGGAYSRNFFGQAIYGLTCSNTWVHVGNLTYGRNSHTSLNVAKQGNPGYS